MTYQDSGRTFFTRNPGTKMNVQEFKIFLGREYKVPTLNENFRVQKDQITTLGRPLYYIPKGYTIKVEKDGILTVDGVLLNDGKIVTVERSDAANDAQRWTLSLLDETGYSDALDYGTAVEIVPAVAPRMRMAVPAGAKTGQAVSAFTSSPTNNAQRWRLEPAGTDTLDGVSTTFYRIVELTTGLALSVQGTSFAQNASVIAETLSSSPMQYLVPARGVGRRPLLHRAARQHRLRGLRPRRRESPQRRGGAARREDGRGVSAVGDQRSGGLRDDPGR